MVTPEQTPLQVSVAMVDPLDPAGEPLLRAMYDVSAAARADRPFEVWAPWPTAYATWTHPSPREQTDVLWVARSVSPTTGPGSEELVVGMASATLPHFDNQHAVYASLFVRPRHQRHGVGANLR